MVKKKKLDVQDLQKMEEPAQDIENPWHGMKKPTAASRMKSISPFFPLAMRNYVQCSVGSLFRPQA
jgi:hypothetical protein